MKEGERKKHWNLIYESKDLQETSWFQPTPSDSLRFIEELNLQKSASIIDVGGGESLLVDHLLELGYSDISVLDVSAVAISKAKQRLGSRSKDINWIISDVLSFHPTRTYDLWHDRATFHFLTNESEIAKYIELAAKAIAQNGFLIIGTFSEHGPDRCSGLQVKQYSEIGLDLNFSNSFEKIHCDTVDHLTPSGELQSFVFCSFSKS